MKNVEDHEGNIEIVSVEEELKKLAPDAGEGCCPHG